MKTPSRKTDGVLVSNKRVSKSGDVKWGGYNADRTYDWEEELVDILKEHDTNILGVVRDTLIGKFGGSEKTWKNRISQMKKKHGFSVNTQNRGQAKKEGWVK